MLKATLPRLKITPPHQISSYSTLMKKHISNVFVKGIYGYLLTAPLKVDTYNNVPTSITGLFSCNFEQLLDGMYGMVRKNSLRERFNSSKNCLETINIILIFDKYQYFSLQ
jgi:hypothetical protein